MVLAPCVFVEDGGCHGLTDKHWVWARGLKEKGWQCCQHDLCERCMKYAMPKISPGTKLQSMMSMGPGMQSPGTIEQREK